MSILIAVGVYRLARHWSSRAEIALAALALSGLLTVAFILAEPRLAMVPLWPSLTGSFIWLTVILVTRRLKLPLDLPAWIVAGLFMLIWPAIILTNYLSSGPNDLPLLAALWVFVVFILLPAIGGAVDNMRTADLAAG